MANIIKRLENNFVIPDFNTAEYNAGTGYYANVIFPPENEHLLRELYSLYSETEEGDDTPSLFNCLTKDGVFLGNITVDKKYGVHIDGENRLTLLFYFAGIRYNIVADLTEGLNTDGSTYRRYYDEAKGVVYYALESQYPGDVTKKCGLTSDNLDENFYFLRGSDIAGAEFVEDDGVLKLTRLNGDVIESNSMNGYIESEVNKNIDEVVSEIYCEMSGLNETLSEMIAEETENRIQSDNAINENISAISGSVENLAETIAEETENRIQSDNTINENISVISGFVENLAETIAEETENRIQSDNTINENISVVSGSVENLAETKAEKTDLNTLSVNFNAFVEDTDLRFNRVTNSITQTQGSLSQESSARENADSELYRLIDKTTMRVYLEREGGYNMNNCLWYGHYFGCNLGRPPYSADGEKYSLTVTNPGNSTINKQLANSISCNNIVNNSPGANGWNGCYGTYTVENTIFAERYYGNYPSQQEHICTMEIAGIPNGVYNLNVLIRGCCTRERDSYLPEPNLDGVSYFISLNGSGLSGYTGTLLATHIDTLEQINSINLAATSVDNKITISLYSGHKNTANWFVIYLNDLSLRAINDEFLAIKQVCQSNTDNDRVYQRLIYTKDRNVFEPPTTIYNAWEKDDSTLIGADGVTVSNSTVFLTDGGVTESKLSQDVVEKIESVSALTNVIADNELVVSASLNNLNERIENTYTKEYIDAQIATLWEAIHQITP